MNPDCGDTDGPVPNAGVDDHPIAVPSAAATETGPRLYNLRGRAVYRNTSPQVKPDIRASMRDQCEDSRRESKFRLHCANRKIDEEGGVKGTAGDTSISRKRGHPEDAGSDSDKIPNKKMLIGALTQLVQSLQADLEDVEVSNVIEFLKELGAKGNDVV